MKVTGVLCNHCHDFIYSRARHDFRCCSCGNVCVDGGFDYMKTAFYDQNFETMEVEVDTTKKDLYDDWNKGKDQYGWTHAPL